MKCLAGWINQLSNLMYLRTNKWFSISSMSGALSNIRIVFYFFAVEKFRLGLWRLNDDTLPICDRIWYIRWYIFVVHPRNPYQS